MNKPRRRGDSYTFTVSCGFNADGERIRKYLTVKRDKSLTDRQWEKELERIGFEFEKKVKKGDYLDGYKTTFVEFLKVWRENYANGLSPKTLYRYEGLLKRIVPALGHLKMAEIKPHHLIEFSKNISGDGMRVDDLYYPTHKLTKILQERNINKKEFANITGTHISTVKKILAGNPTNIAFKICEALNITIEDAFEVKNGNEKLSQQTILHHHRLISSILEKAVKLQVITENPAKRIDAPKVKKKVPRYYQSDEIFIVLEKLDNVDIKHKAMIYTAILIGCRLSELGGLMWDDIDFEKNQIHIMRASQHIPGRETFLKDPKNQSSIRTIAAPQVAMDVLAEYKVWHDSQRAALGEMWIDSGMLFTQTNGAIMHPNTPAQWFLKFRRRENLKDVNFHGLRHSHATLLLSIGAAEQTIIKRFGWSSSETMKAVYSHFEVKADKGVSDILEDEFKKYRKGKDENENK